MVFFFFLLTHYLKYHFEIFDVAYTSRCLHQTVQGMNNRYLRVDLQCFMIVKNKISKKRSSKFGK